MASKRVQQKRKTTKYKGVYYNETTKKYDVKYNFKVYDPLIQKNKYKSQWVYNLPTLTDARRKLAEMQSNGIKVDDKDITLDGAYRLWLKMADNQGFSPATKKNMKYFMQVVCKHISKDMKIKDITEDVYLSLVGALREEGYADESMRNLTNTIRKLITLCYKRKLISTNVLAYVDGQKTVRPDHSDLLISAPNFKKLDAWYQNQQFVRKGVNTYPKHRLLLNILYDTGCRIGEALALTYDDFKEHNWYPDEERPDDQLLNYPTTGDVDKEHYIGMSISITKAYLSDFRMTKSPKNFKHRTVPLSPQTQRLFGRMKQDHLAEGGSIDDKVFPFSHGAAASVLKKACSECGLPSYHCHMFRHTFISNCIRNNIPITVISKCSGDDIQTIYKNYSHMWEGDDVMIAKMQNKLRQ